MRRIFTLILVLLGSIILSCTYANDASESMLSALNLEHFEDLEEQAIDGAMALEGYARLIAGLGALFLILTSLWKTWGQNLPVDMSALMKPCAVFLLIVCFDVVPLFIDAFIQPFEDATEQLKESSKDAYTSALSAFADKYFLGMQNADQNKNDDMEESSDVGVITAVSSILTLLSRVTSPLGLMNLCGMLFNMACYYFLSFLASAVVICIYIFSLVSKVILIIIGPIAMALYLFPFFHDSMRLWFCRYINVSLYIPISNIVAYCLNYTYINLFYAPSLEVIDKGEVLFVTDYFSGNVIACVFLFAGIIMYCMVPKIAGWIIDGQGNGIIGSAVGNIAGVAGRYAAGSVGSAVVSTAVK